MAKIKYKTQSELIHLWANGKIKDSRQVASIKVINGSIYHRSIKVTLRKNGIVFIKNFDSIGAFSNGINARMISNAIPNDKYLLVNSLPTASTFKFKSKHLIKEMLDFIEQDLKRIALYKELIYNNRVRSLYYTNFDTNSDLKDFESLYGKTVYNSVINRIITYNSSYKNYTGWGRNSYTEYEARGLKFKLKDIIENGIRIFFTDEEIEILQYLKWRNEWISSGSKFEHFEVYKNIEERVKYEQNINKRKEQFYIKRITNKLKTYTDSILKWRESNSCLYKSDSNFPTYLKLVGDTVYTSNGANVPIDAAKKAYRLYKIGYDKETKIGYFTWQGIKTFDIYKLDENNIPVKTQVKGIKIGCTYISEEAIEDFINYYKLDWNETN